MGPPAGSVAASDFESQQVPIFHSVGVLRVTFWIGGLLLAAWQAWNCRYVVSADSISYLDMSDGVMPGGSWHRLINGLYSGLYPLSLGIFRRVFHISPQNEVPAGHLLNVLFFIFAFIGFEFLLAGIVEQSDGPRELPDKVRTSVPLPRWAFRSIAYSVFLWASIVAISLDSLRADMLMSGFLYFAVGKMIRMRHRPASWISYLALGAVLGLGVLAKEAMLPVGLLILLLALLVVENWRPALKMAAGALAMMFLIASLYFVPLSLRLGHISLGEAGKFVYIVNVDEASPHWYLQTPGSARGSLLHPPKKVFADPPAYAFPVTDTVTHPLRYDPTYWTVGLRPHFVWQREATAIKSNLLLLKGLLGHLRVVLGAIVVLAFLCSSRKEAAEALARAWPVWLIGLAGCLMYVAIFVDSRYVGGFLALLCVGMLAGFSVPADSGRKLAQIIVVVCIFALLYSASRETYLASVQQPRSNVFFEAAQALESSGIRQGDHVARISPGVADFLVERILRTQIVAEVDLDHTIDFWSSPFATQQSLLSKFAAQGVKAVIATSPVLTAQNRFEWKQLGSTPYWVWFPNQPAASSN